MQDNVAANVAAKLAARGVTVSTVGAVAAPTIEARVTLQIRAEAVPFKSKAEIVDSLNDALDSPTLTDTLDAAGIPVDEITVVEAATAVSGYPMPPPPPPSPSPPPVLVPKAKDNTQLYIIAGACSGGGLFLGLVAFGIWYATRKNAAATKAATKGGYSTDPGGVRFDPFGGAGKQAEAKQAQRAAKKAAWEKRRREDSVKAARGGGADVERGGGGGGMFASFSRKKHAKVSPMKGPVVSKPMRGGGKGNKDKNLQGGNSVFNVGSADQQMSALRADQARDRVSSLIAEKDIDSSFVWEGASKRGGGWGDDGDFGTGPRGTA